MDGRRFDLLSRWLVSASSRRTTVRALAAGALTAGLGGLGLAAAAAKKKKRKNKLKKNEYGCVNVGGKCKGKDTNCCSGICQGKKPKKGKKDKSTCVAHNVLDCPAGADECAGGVACELGFCWQTTGQASFCGVGVNCVACKKDVECEPDFGPGAACIVCADLCPQTGTVCVLPAG